MTNDADDTLAVLVRGSHTGDDRAVAELKGNLPGLVRLAELEDLERIAREAWAAARIGNLLGGADRLRVLEEAAARLARPSAGPLERMLAGSRALSTARLADLQRLVELAGSEGPTVARDIARRVKRAEREVAAADRILRAFQERMPPGS